nr:hypothetical protein OG781_41160 [Streptomyces sp. NBC_00830]
MIGLAGDDLPSQSGQLRVVGTAGHGTCRERPQRETALAELPYVFCRNGARVPGWAESVTLAKSAVAYNSGTLNRAREAGVQYMQVFDGAGCGWTSHKDPDKAGTSWRWP